MKQDGIPQLSRKTTTTKHNQIQDNSESNKSDALDNKDDYRVENKIHNSNIEDIKEQEN